MSESEVEAILGKPSYFIMPGYTFGPDKNGTALYLDDGLLRKRRDALLVSFHNGLVDRCWIAPGPPDERSLWERLRDRVAELRAAYGW
jgi:hypothetical protein